MGDRTVPQTLSSSGNSGNANPLGFSTSTMKFAFKSIPGFNPTFYRAWASDVQDAFTEREWINYLIPPSSILKSLSNRRPFYLNPSHTSIRPASNTANQLQESSVLFNSATVLPLAKMNYASNPNLCLHAS